MIGCVKKLQGYIAVSTVWDGSVANTSPLEYQKYLQYWKMITILFNAIYPFFYVENIEFLIKVIDVKKPFNRINGLGTWRPYCKMAAILQTSEHFDCLWNKIRILKVHIIYSLNQFLLFAAALKQRVVVQYSPWRPSWKMSAILKTTKQYLLVSIALKLHSMCISFTRSSYLTVCCYFQNRL